MLRFAALAGLALGMVLMFGGQDATAQMRRMRGRPMMPMQPMGTSLPMGGGNLQGALNNPQLLKRFDTNGNGVLDPNEREAARKALEKAKTSGNGDTKAKILEKFDKNGDGKLSETERSDAKQALEQLKAKKPQ